MPSVSYMNNTAPFWDFVANLENQGAQHPFFAGRGGNNNMNRDESSGDEAGPSFMWGPWGRPYGRGWGHHGPHGPHHHRRGPPPPPNGEYPPPPPGAEGPPPPPPFEKATDGEKAPPEYEEPSGPANEQRGPGAHRGPGGRCGRGRGHGPGPGGFGGRRGRGGFGGPFAFGPLVEMFQSQIWGEEGANKNETGDFKPDIDVFDTETAFVVHASLPGAKKEDVGVNWDAEKSELSIAGVVYRPGDEEFLKTLSMEERRVGPFERKVRLGSRANPAQVDAEGITAKLEDGVLRVEVPKMKEEFVEVKKVEIE